MQVAQVKFIKEDVEKAVLYFSEQGVNLSWQKKEVWQFNHAAFRIVGAPGRCRVGAAGVTSARIGLCKDSVLRKLAAIVHMSEPEDAQKCRARISTCVSRTSDSQRQTSFLTG